MKQVYHSNAVTNIHIRSEINGSNLTNKELANKFNISTVTVSKWKNRDSLEDKSSRPKTIHYSLSALETAIIITLRKLTWFSLYEITELVFHDNPYSKRSAVYRLFVREGINKKPQQVRDKAKKFKEYEPGFLHIDVTYLPKINGKRYYLFVAIDRATRLVFYKVYEAKTAENAKLFLEECVKFFPFKITYTLTDNGLEFTNERRRSKRGNKTNKPSPFDKVCFANNIQHRLTMPNTPKTNGMVEKVNDTIKSATIKLWNYYNAEQMINDLCNFLVNYNLLRRHSSLRKELKVKTPFEAMTKWYELNPKLFKLNPYKFKNKILNLKPK